MALPITLSNAPSSAQWRGIASALLMLSVIASITASVYLDINQRFTSGNAEYNQESYANLDRGILASNPRKALLLRFSDFDPTYQQFVATLYFRSVYLLYPVPVLLGNPAHFVNDYRQVWEANTPRDNAWLNSHHVDVVLSYSMTDHLSRDVRSVGDRPAIMAPDQANR
ncbi:MAG: hypothetical protein M3O30_00305 [Planctomycetota bacterium]|nr:hypothetical protein [Planctomycetota bacterium]